MGRSKAGKITFSRFSFCIGLEGWPFILAAAFLYTHFVPGIRGGTNE